MAEHPLWSDEELASSLDVYFFMLRLEVEGIPFVKTKLEKGALVGPLTERNLTSIRFRLRNISFVFQELGFQSLKAYPPASQVGTHVRARIENLLAARTNDLDEIHALRSKKLRQKATLQEAHKKLDELKSILERLSNDQEVIGIGHNNPPGTVKLFKDEFDEAISSISGVQKALVEPKLTESRFRKVAAPILVLGQKLASWIGSHATIFSKSYAKAAGQFAGITTGGLLVLHAKESIFDAISTAYNFLF